MELFDGWVFSCQNFKIRLKILLVLDRTSLEEKDRTSVFYDTYQMFDIFYNNTNGDQFNQTSLSQEGLDQSKSEK